MHLKATRICHSYHSTLQIVPYGLDVFPLLYLVAKDSESSPQIYNDPEIQRHTDFVNKKLIFPAIQTYF